jgi:hypothetical protein
MRALSVVLMIRDNGSGIVEIGNNAEGGGTVELDDMSEIMTAYLNFLQTIYPILESAMPCPPTMN